jgi:hypothetical protein
MSSPGAERGRSPSPRRLAALVAVAAAFVALFLLFQDRLSLGPSPARAYPPRTLQPEPEPVLLAAPEPDPEYFPCSECHEDEPPNYTVRELEDEHDTLELAHGNLWCFHCHQAEERDRLHLADGTQVRFEESWRLCTQCHAKKLPDWRAGVHGKRTGFWWGPKEYRTCVVCHEPHSPRFRALEPKPRPLRASEIGLSARLSEEGAGGGH